MTLEEYEVEFGNKRKVGSNGSIYIELPHNQTDEERYSLWDLEDYYVTSASYLTVWLMAKATK
jgi:hypothetical protein